MHKGVKKYNLNTSDKQHGHLMLRNLFTSLLLNDRVVTTEKKAKSLKSYAQKALARYKKGFANKILEKTWLKQNILTRKEFKKAVEKLQSMKDAKIHLLRSHFRSGDGALMYEVRLEIISETKEKHE